LKASRLVEKLFESFYTVSGAFGSFYSILEASKFFISLIRSVLKVLDCFEVIWELLAGFKNC